MTDETLVQRLRGAEPCKPGNICRSLTAAAGCVCAESADRIEELEHRVQQYDILAEKIFEIRADWWQDFGFEKPAQNPDPLDAAIWELINHKHPVQEPNR